MVNTPLARIAAQTGLRWLIQASTIGGSAETDAIALTVTASRPAAPEVATTATAVAARRMAATKASRSAVWAALWAMAGFLVSVPRRGLRALLGLRKRRSLCGLASEKPKHLVLCGSGARQSDRPAGRADLASSSGQSGECRKGGRSAGSLSLRGAKRHCHCEERSDTVIARSEATRQSPRRCATGRGLLRYARNDSNMPASPLLHPIALPSSWPGQAGHDGEGPAHPTDASRHRSCRRSFAPAFRSPMTAASRSGNTAGRPADRSSSDRT
jgi:hypothetical protein